MSDTHGVVVRVTTRYLSDLRTRRDAEEDPDEREDLSTRITFVESLLRMNRLTLGDLMERGGSRLQRHRAEDDVQKRVQIEEHMHALCDLLRSVLAELDEDRERSQMVWAVMGPMAQIVGLTIPGRHGGPR